jgi:hypothetical protein
MLILCLKNLYRQINRNLDYWELHLQEAYSRESILQVTDCTIMNNLDKLVEVDYVPTKVCNYAQSRIFEVLFTSFLILEYYFVLIVFEVAE